MQPQRATDEVGPGAETNSRNNGLNLVDVTLGLKIRTLRPGFEYRLWKVNLKPTRLVHATRCQGAILSVLTEFERKKMHASKTTKQLTGRETEFAKDLRGVTLAQFLGRQDLFELTANRIDSRGKDLNFTR